MPKEKRKSYTQEDINSALKELQNGMPLRESARKYNVPRSTLYCKWKTIYPVECSKGPPTILRKKN